MNKLLNKSWWIEVIERAIKSAAQMALITIGGAMTLAEVGWIHVASAAGLAALLSVLTSIATLPDKEVNDGNADNSAESDVS